MMDSTPNEIFQIAADIISNTSQSVFLTGRAGTGKTTFLHYIRNNVDKNMVVAAPTGVAAINAGGVTLHSWLQLPFEPFIPDFEGKKKLDFHFRLRKSKIELLQELELIIIDEVSMLRADMLDSIDYMLRRYRNNQQVFGGVQMLFIGDLFQLPPVVQNREWELLRPYYASPFFFHAQALNGNLPLYIELKKIYRQSDQGFIDILNRIRNNQSTAQDLEILNQRYNPNFSSTPENRYITLCTHNYKADQINQTELQRLTAKTHSFKGQVSGDFAENSFPTEIDLSLKEGAQVMFVKNDVGEQRRYYNGKLATVKFLSEHKICVEFENGHVMDLEKETWHNVRYTLNQESGEIEQEELGSFSQYPIRLAWAITIHKSQGLTFDRVIIDAGQAFAAGQVYVALSRCTTLEGIILYSKITPTNILTDREALSFAQQEKDVDYLTQVLNTEKPNYCAWRLKKAFDWSPMTRSTRALYELISEKKIPDQEQAQGMASLMCDKALEHESIATNFCREIDRILYLGDPNFEMLKERVQKATLYFHNDILKHIALPLDTHLKKLKNAARIKLYLKRVKEINAGIVNFLEKLENVYYGDTKLTEGIQFSKVESIEEEAESVKESKESSQKGDTQRLTLSLFNEGKSMKEIASERNLTVTTVENHLVRFVNTGEIEAKELMGEEAIAHLTPLLERYTVKSPLKAIKDSIPEKYTYFNIKVMLNYLDYKRNN